MSLSIKNLYQFRTTSKITQAQGATSTFTVGNDIFTNTAVSITAWSIQLTNRTGSIVELFTVTVAAWVATIAARGIKPDWTTDAIYQYERPKNTLCTLTVLENQIFDKWGSETLTGNLTYSWNVIYSKSVKRPVYADATARDAWIPSPANGMMIYNTALWLNQQYIWWSWVNVDTGTATGNATEWAVWLWELGTTAEVTAWSATWGAWPLILTPDKASAQSQSWTRLYGVDAGGDDTYVFALTPTMATYTTWQILLWKVSTSNTWACTADFWPWVKNIKNIDWTDPVSWDITAGKICIFLYDWTNLVLQNPNNRWLYISTAWLAITAWEALRPAVTLTWETLTQNTWWSFSTPARLWYDATYQYSWQTITTTATWFITTIKVYLRKSWSPTGNISCKLYDSTKVTLLESSTTTIAESTLSAWSTTECVFTFAWTTPLWIWVVAYRLEVDRANSTSNYTLVEYDNGAWYVWWTMFNISSWLSWVDASKDARFVVITTAWSENSSKLYKASANIASTSVVVWFAKTTVVADESIPVDTIINTSQSWLTIWTTYYLSNTPWAVSTSAGVVSTKVWRWASTTSLLVNIFWA